VSPTAISVVAPTLYQCFFTLPSVRCGKVCHCAIGQRLFFSCSDSMDLMNLYFCNLAPAVACISHLFQSELFSWRPRRVCPALFQFWLLCSGINISCWGRSTGCVRIGAPSRARHAFWRLIQRHRLALSVRGRRQRRRWWGTALRLLTCRGDGWGWLQAWQLS
jgi:hypothetical protein